MTPMSTSKGAFISFEGIDCCGKSTQVKMLDRYLKKNGNKTLLVREPGGTIISEEIRNILLHRPEENISDRTEALLMTGSRSQLTFEKIIPSINMGINVIADRFLDSTLAYQGGGRELDLNWLIELNKFATFNTLPNVTIFIDITSELGAERNNSEGDRIENAGIDFQSRVRDTYIKLSQIFKDRYVTIDGEMDIQTIHNKIISTLMKRNLI